MLRFALRDDGCGDKEHVGVVLADHAVVALARISPERETRIVEGGKDKDSLKAETVLSEPKGRRSSTTRSILRCSESNEN